jgi:thioredoxin-dependent peroxiredoxin
MATSKVADFNLPTNGGGHFKLSDYKGKIVVLYFYPKDSTPGCTTEGLDFAVLHPQFLKANAIVVGVSRDSVKSHDNFCAKQGFPFPLISDTEEKLCTQFDVIHMKNMYGKQVRGVVRSTFVIGADGKLAHEWRGVKVPGHAQAVLDFVKTLG